MNEGKGGLRLKERGTVMRRLECHLRVRDSSRLKDTLVMERSLPQKEF